MPSYKFMPNQNAGKIDITDTDDKYNAKNVDDALDELGETKFWNGFDRYDEDTMGTLSWVNSTRTITIDVKTGQSEYHFWVKGKKITKTTSASVAVPNTTGVYYTYLDENGDAQYKLDADVRDDEFFDYALFGLVHWNATLSEVRYQDERHGIRMSGMTHLYNHVTDGARYQSGLEITGLTKGGTTYTSISAGKIWDEDIKHIIASATSTKFSYRSGAAGEWNWTSASTDVSYNAGSTYDVWNEWDGSIWKLSQGGSSTDYWIVFYTCFPWTNDTAMTKIIGQNAYSSRNNARDAVFSEISNITSNGLPNQEFVWLYATIVNRKGEIQKLDDGSLYLDLRTTRGTGSGNSSSSGTLIRIATATTSGTDTALVVTGIDYNAYSNYVVKIDGIRQHSSSSAALLLELLDSSGNALSTNYSGKCAYIEENDTAWNFTSSSSGFVVSMHCYAASPRSGVSGEGRLHVATSEHPTFESRCASINASTVHGTVNVCGGTEVDTTAVAQVRVRSGNNDALTTGKIILYGVIT